MLFRSRISGDEKMGEGCAGLEHMKKIAPLLVDAGLDCLDVSAGSTAGSGDWIGQPVYYERGCIVHLAEAVKKVVSVPVVTAGRINNPGLAEKIVSTGRADIVSIGRGALADPDFANKALAGKSEDIRQCTACYIGCARVDTKGSMCSVNYEFGRFRGDYEITPASRPKKVMVIGGGIAGMETARVAALRGHEVRVYEKGKTLGGRVISMAGAIPNVNTSDLMLGVKWLRRQMDALKIPVALRTEITPELVEKEKPDVVVLATGSVNSPPEIPGMDKTHVLTVDDYLVHKKELGEKVAVIGGQHGAEAALSLARAGKTVTIIEEKKAIALAPYLLTRRFVLLGYLKEEGIETLTRASVKEINETGVKAVDPEGKERTIEADSILLALERRPDDGLEKQLKRMVAEIYKVGDCDRPLHTFHAFHSANRIARRI